MKCTCGKTLTSKMEVECSQSINEFFCSPACATDRYYQYLESSPVDFTQSIPENVGLVDGFLVREASQQSVRSTRLRLGNKYEELACKECGAWHNGKCHNLPSN